MLRFKTFFFFIQGLSEDKHFISDSLLSRIQDDDPSVVACVLKLGQVDCMISLETECYSVDCFMIKIASDTL